MTFIKNSGIIGIIETYVLSYNAVQCIVQLEVFGRRDFHFLFSKIKIQSTCENKVLYMSV